MEQLNDLINDLNMFRVKADRLSKFLLNFQNQIRVNRDKQSLSIMNLPYRDTEWTSGFLGDMLESYSDFMVKLIEMSDLSQEVSSDIGELIQYLDLDIVPSFEDSE